MKKSIFAAVIAAVALAACSSPNDTEEELMSHEGKQYVEIAEGTDTEEAYITAYETIKSMDFVVRVSPLELTPEVDAMYKTAYLKILKSEIPTAGYGGEMEYFRDLYGIGNEFDKMRTSEYEYYSYYYNDLDGDGLPELGIRYPGYTYILKYQPDVNEFTVLFKGPSMYNTILGTGQIWYHDGLHAGVVRDRYIVLNIDNEWETVLALEEGIYQSEEEDGLQPYYSISINKYEKFVVDGVTWDELTAPFFDAMEAAVPSRSSSEAGNNFLPPVKLEEVFGELLYAD